MSNFQRPILVLYFSIVLLRYAQIGLWHWLLVQEFFFKYCIVSAIPKQSQAEEVIILF